MEPPTAAALAPRRTRIGGSSQRKTDSPPPRPAMGCGHPAGQAWGDQLLHPVGVVGEDAAEHVRLRPASSPPRVVVCGRGRCRYGSAPPAPRRTGAVTRSPTPPRSGFNRSSQHRAVRTSVPVRQRLPLRFPTVDFSGPVVERIGDRLKFTEVVSGQISSLRKILPQRTIRVFIRSELSWTVRIAEVDTNTGRGGQLGMAREFLSAIPCHGFA